MANIIWSTTLALLSSFAWVSLLVGSANAQKAVMPRVTMTSDDADGMVALGEKIVVAAIISNRAGQPIEGELTWVVHTVAFRPPEPRSIDVSIPSGESAIFKYQISLNAAGFGDIECELTQPNVGKTLSKRFRVGANPLQIDIAQTKQPDFDDFWRRSLLQLRGVKPDFKLTPFSDRSSESLDVFEVTMTSFGGVHVRGWLEVPKRPGPHPVVIRLPGYGGNMKPIGRRDDLMVFSFNPRAHGNSQEEVPHDPVDYWIRDLESKSDYFYRGAYLDCVRAVDYICSRNDVDQDRIAVWGGSQGGGLAFATAALDQRVDLCVADIPFMCDWGNYFRLTDWPEMNQWIKDRPEQTWGSTLRTLSYFDTVNLADRISCPTLMGVGLQDQVCPPTTCFAAFNQIPAQKKDFRIYRDSGHGLGREHDEWIWEQICYEFGIVDKTLGD